MSETLVIRDDSTHDDLVEALANLCGHARKQQYVVEKLTTDVPTAWTRAHQRINAVLDDLCPPS